MFLIFLTNIDNNIGDVPVVCSDWSNMPQERIKEGYFVNKIPVQDLTQGDAHLKYNITTTELYYIYTKVDRPLNIDEKVAALELENANINYALMLGGLI